VKEIVVIIIPGDLIIIKTSLYQTIKSVSLWRKCEDSAQREFQEGLHKTFTSKVDKPH
jgi:hypothetical protein